MSYKEGVESMIKDYERWPDFGKGLWQTVMGPLLNNYFEGKYAFEEMVEVAARLAGEIALEYGREDLVGRYSTEVAKNYAGVLDQLSKKMEIEIGPEGRRAITYFDLFFLTLAGLIREVILTQRSDLEQFAEVSYKIGDENRTLRVNRMTLAQGLVKSEGLTGMDVGGVTMIWEEGIAESEREDLREAIESLKTVAADGTWRDAWMEEIDRLVIYVGEGFRGARATKIYSETDPGFVLIGKGFLGEEILFDDVLMMLGHELDHLAYFRWLIQMKAKVASAVLMEITANDAGLRLGKAIGARKDVLGGREEENRSYLRIAAGDVAGIFSTFEWDAVRGWFDRRGMANDWRRIAKVVARVLEIEE